MDFELRILQGIGLTDKLQYRTKDVWPYDTVPSLDNRSLVWSKWKDVPRVWKQGYEPPEDK